MSIKCVAKEIKKTADTLFLEVQSKNHLMIFWKWLWRLIFFISKVYIDPPPPINAVALALEIAWAIIRRTMDFDFLK